jgi:hypothetical protein
MPREGYMFILTWMKMKIVRLVLFPFWPILLWKYQIGKGDKEVYLLIFLGFLSAAAFFSMYFIEDIILSFAVGFSGGMLFYIGYLLKKLIMDEDG